MKKGLLFFIAFASIIMVFLLIMQNNFLTFEDSKEKIVKEHDVTLNEFLSGYKNNKYVKIEIEDSTNLLGYEFKGTETQTSMSLRKEIKIVKYDLYKSKKPVDLSIKDLGLSFTGDVPILIKFNEKSMLSKVFLESILPILIFLVVLIFLLKVFGPKGGGFPFGTQAGKLRTKADVKTNFGDAAGMEEAKDELKEIVDYLKNPSKYLKVGARIPRGVLLFGPPGSGKTLLARAIAGEADVPFYSASGSEFMEMLVGMGAAKVRELFKKAKNSSPAIVFIDEIDTIGKKRGAGYTGGHQEQEQTLNQILTEMDGFEKETKVIVVAATNRPDVLDPALMRPGRFDRKIYIGRPTIEEREDILKIHCRDKKLSKDAELRIIARRTSGFVGADLANIANEAALKTARENRIEVTMDDLEFALEKMVMGPEKKIKTIKEKEKQTIAFHELGHAVTGYYLPNTDPIEKISIVSRGLALGVTWMMPEEDRYLYSKAKFLDEMVTLVGGRAAETVFFGENEITTGAANDFEKATKIASDMILKFGMDEDLGPVLYYDQEKTEWQPFKPYSENTSKIIDKKLKWLLASSMNKAIKIIKENKKTIEILAEILLIKEYLTRDEFKDYMESLSKAKKALKELQEEKERDKKKKKENEDKLANKKAQKKSDKDKNNLDNSSGLLGKFLKK